MPVPPRCPPGWGCPQHRPCRRWGGTGRLLPPCLPPAAAFAAAAPRELDGVKRGAAGLSWEPQRFPRGSTMLAPKKGLLCNLNHIHLQHISLGLHLSRHPELQDGSTAAGEQTGCTQCPENREPVDANSNNASVKCRCCQSHPAEPEPLGLQNQEDFPCLHSGDEEEAASPCDPPCDLASSSSSSSSSVSSCSDFSLDDSPVSVYCKEFARAESQSPDKQLNVIATENAWHGEALADGDALADGEDRADEESLADGEALADGKALADGEALADQHRTCHGRDANHNSPVPLRATAAASKSPDSLCSNNSLDSHCDELSPGTAAPETTGPCADLDPNCNPLPEPDAAPPAPPPVPERRDAAIPSSAPQPRPRPGGLPPPVPPRPRRRLQVLNAHRAEQPQAGPGELCRDAATKTITSFHELAQRRKRNAAGPTLAQARVDRSDWLIVFSPDTELPPSSELLSGTAGQERPQPQPQPQQDGPARPPGSRQREVTTFKELRSRSAARQPKGQRAEPAQHPPVPPVPPASLGGTPLLAPSDGHQPRRRARPSLQPIAEGQPRDVETGGLPPGEKGLGAAPLRRLGGPGGDPAVPRAAQRGDETRTGARPEPLVPGAAAGAAAGAAGPGGGRAEGPHGEQTKALLVAVSSAVDKVIAHFSTARNLVQKAQLGDSRLNPDVGYLLLHTLCPALCALVEDGLKPFQKDVITGQRKNSPWSVVEASVKTGPGSRSLHALCWHVAGLAPLSSPRQKFHAFILGLLNIKQLELWISQLQKSPGVISVLYSPTAFFALSQGPLPHLADELLLLIQPLSVLTFHLDLLFEHHHLSVDVRPLSRRLESPLSPGCPPVPARGSLGLHSAAAGHSLQDEPPPDALGRVGGAGGRCQAPVGGLVPAPPVGAALQQTLQQVLRWGDQLGRSLLGSDSPPQGPGPREGSAGTGAGLGGCWGQLSQSSRVYTAPSKDRFPSVWWTKLRAAGEPSPGQAGQCPTSSEPRGTELQLLQTKAGPEPSVPKPSGSTDTSGTSSPEDLFLPAGSGALTKLEDPSAGRNPLAAPPEPPGSRNPAAAPGPGGGDPPAAGRGSWLGWLFGATSPACRSFPSSPDSAAATSRRPSRWLAPGPRALAGLLRALAPDGSRAPEQPGRTLPAPAPAPAPAPGRRGDICGAGQSGYCVTTRARPKGT
ncbi:AP-4 complex accessory subunit RUSC1 isoform X2 [Passer domesticus]|uniref:AP-4 complex accessory subunit RUSC1 isoform X2 n=1 Tax=Passer domesticus TaxID=48849 RepID=UPI0030FEBB3A